MEIAGIEPATLCMLSTRATNCAKSPRNSVTGNRTPVSRVTGGDTSHYTMTDKLRSGAELRITKLTIRKKMAGSSFCCVLLVSSTKSTITTTPQTASYNPPFSNNQWISESIIAKFVTFVQNVTSFIIVVRLHSVGRHASISSYF